MIREMAEACAKIYFRGKTRDLATYNIYINAFIARYSQPIQ
jgi:hypothetical protein